MRNNQMNSQKITFNKTADSQTIILKNLPKKGLGNCSSPKKEMNKNFSKKIFLKNPLGFFRLSPWRKNPNLRLTKTLEMGLWFNPSLEPKGEEGRQLCFINSCKAFGREECLKKNERVVWQRQRQLENCG
jgi:hypothetical protein